MIGLKLLNEDQDLAAEKLYEWYYNKNKSYPWNFFLYGYAGTGKTYIISKIPEILNIDVKKILYVAPTGKAANVLQRKGIDAKTIHRVFYKVSYADKICQEMCDRLSELLEEELGESEEAKKIKKTLKDAKVNFAPIDKDVIEGLDVELIVVDESSMIKDDSDGFEGVYTDLCRFEVPTVFVGDPMQLPPFKKGSILKSLLDVKKPNVFLKNIVRQEKGNPIIEFAHNLRFEKLNFKSELIKDYSVVDKFCFNFNYETDKIITASNKRAVELNINIKKMRMSKILFEKGVERKKIHDIIENYYKRLIKGDLLLCQKNDYDLDIFNGEEFLVDEVLIKDKRFPQARLYSLYGDKSIIDDVGMEHCNEYIENKLDCNYLYGGALTCHKSQGSQWANVLVVVQNWKTKQDDFYRWLYTAVTRASKTCTIVFEN